MTILVCRVDPGNEFCTRCDNRKELCGDWAGWGVSPDQRGQAVRAAFTAEVMRRYRGWESTTSASGGRDEALVGVVLDTLGDSAVFGAAELLETIDRGRVSDR